MEPKEFAYIIESSKSFEDTIVSVLKSIDEQGGWSVFSIYDLKERLAAKEFKIKRLKIIELCSAKHANTLLGKEKLVSLCLPCRINILEDEGKVLIASMRPSIIPNFFQNIEKNTVVEIEAEIISIIKKAK